MSDNIAIKPEAAKKVRIRVLHSIIEELMHLFKIDDVAELDVIEKSILEEQLLDFILMYFVGNEKANEIQIRIDWHKYLIFITINDEFEFTINAKSAIKDQLLYVFPIVQDFLMSITFFQIKLRYSFLKKTWTDNQELEAFQKSYGVISVEDVEIDTPALKEEADEY